MPFKRRGPLRDPDLFVLRGEQEAGDGFLHDVFHVGASEADFIRDFESQLQPKFLQFLVRETHSTPNGQVTRVEEVCGGRPAGAAWSAALDRPKFDSKQRGLM